MKPKINQKNSIYGNGFTLIEMLVVISIMGVMLSVFLIDLNGQKTNRNLKIAQNEMVTNVRKIQSYTLSSRGFGEAKTVLYYILKFDLSHPTEYYIQAMYQDSSNTWKLINVETVKLPVGIRLAASGPISITPPPGLTLSSLSPDSCALVAFKNPFAKTYIEGINYSDSGDGNGDGKGDCELSAFPMISPNDNHKKIINFITNTNNYPVSTDTIIVIKLTDEKNSVAPKTITINGISGLVSFN